jgi:hypothetical protein
MQPREANNSKASFQHAIGHACQTEWHVGRPDGRFVRWHDLHVRSVRVASRAPPRCNLEISDVFGDAQ